jgi:hypothetical protein
VVRDSKRLDVRPGYLARCIPRRRVVACLGRRARSGDGRPNARSSREIRCAGPSRRSADHHGQSSRSAARARSAPARSAACGYSTSSPRPGSPSGPSSQRAMRPSSRSTLHREGGEVIGPGVPPTSQHALSKGRAARSLPRNGGGNRGSVRRSSISPGNGAGTRRAAPAGWRRHRPHRGTDLDASAVTPIVDRAA